MSLVINPSKTTPKTIDQLDREPTQLKNHVNKVFTSLHTQMESKLLQEISATLYAVPTENLCRKQRLSLLAHVSNREISMNEPTRSATLHTLLENEELVLHAFDGNVYRFLESFRQTWNQIPENERQLILSLCIEHRAKFELSDDWDPLDSWGQVHTEIDLEFGSIVSLTVRFRAEGMDHFPARAAHWVIAHELAHVYEKALGIIPLALDKLSESEPRADKIAEGWGFTPHRLNLILFIMHNRALSISDACEIASRGSS